MKTQHWLFLVIVFIVGYFVGIHYPALGQKVPVIG